MKKLLKIPAILFVLILIISSCGKGTKSHEKTDVDICKCMTQPGNSTFMQENNDACRDAISKEIGVTNWERVNMSLSQNSRISAKFDTLAKRCQ